jgi:hypothetical protein
LLRIVQAWSSGSSTVAAPLRERGGRRKGAVTAANPVPSSPLGPLVTIFRPKRDRVTHTPATIARTIINTLSQKSIATPHSGLRPSLITDLAYRQTNATIITISAGRTNAFNIAYLLDSRK